MRQVEVSDVQARTVTRGAEERRGAYGRVGDGAEDGPARLQLSQPLRHIRAACGAVVVLALLAGCATLLYSDSASVSVPAEATARGLFKEPAQGDAAADAAEDDEQDHASVSKFLSPAPQTTEKPKEESGNGFWSWAMEPFDAVKGAFDQAAISLKLMTSTSTSTVTTTSTATGTSTTQTSTTQTSTTGTTTSVTTTSKTETTSTQTTTSTKLCSLFCFAVVRIGSYEPGLMQVLSDKKASIFQCDEHAVYGNGGVAWIGGVATKEIPAPSVQMGNLSKSGTTTSSWLNTMIFMEAWNLVFDEGRWWNHEWTVKVDPDAVFFPSRLQVKLYPYYTAGVDDGPAWFVADCDRTWNGDPPALKIFGSMEVYSRNALGMYKAHQQQCKDDLPWKGWGEDLYMEQCMKKMKVGVVNGVSFLGDERCHPAACWDQTKVVFHAFKDVGAWLNCWQQSQPEVVFK